MKQTYLMPNTVLMNVCGEFSQIVCASGDGDPSLPNAPKEGSGFHFGSKKI